MTQDDSEIAHLLAAARQADLPDAARLARVRARLPQPVAATGQSPQSSSSASVALRGIAVKVSAAMLVVGAGVFVYRQVSVPRAVEPASVERRPAAPSQPVPIAEPDASVAIVPPEPALPEITLPPQPSAATPAKRTPRKRTPIAAPPEQAKSALPVSTLNEESSLLRLVTLAARACRLDEAQARLAQFTERYPNSQLNAERERLSASIRELSRTGQCKPRE
jgi:hypothetical protein